MNSLELTKPITTESLLSEFESRFNQTMDLSKFTKEEAKQTRQLQIQKVWDLVNSKNKGLNLVAIE